MTSEQLVTYWFKKSVKKYWFNSTPEFDQQLREQFEQLWQQAKEGQLEGWKNSAIGCLALVILFDQIPLNIFRNQAQSFATEALAREVAQHAIKRKLNQQLSKEKQVFLYMPFMHSEDINDQKYSLELFKLIGQQDNLRFAHHHHDIVKRFGRFPHRNEILRRDNSAEELEYLNSKEAFSG